MIQKKTLVISAVNFSEGGALTVLKDLLTALQKRNTANFNIFIVPITPVSIVLIGSD